LSVGQRNGMSSCNQHSVGVLLSTRTQEDHMGLLDVLNGMRNGPHGQANPTDSKGGGMSPITMAILALLAYKGIKNFGGQATAPAGDPQRHAAVPDQQGGGLGDVLGGLFGGGAGGSSGGGLGGLLQGGLGGLLAGGAAGNVLSGGLNDLLKQFQQNGHGATANSWVGTGQNQDISENDLAKSIGNDDIDALTRHTGLPRDELLAGLRRELPGAIDELTPDGRVPSGQELSRRV
jgi:uncharacterized protein YidB (DUF937 family)